MKTSRRTPLEWNFETIDAMNALASRKAFMRFLHYACQMTSDFDGAEIVFGELVSNVALHAPGPISIHARQSSNGIALDVYDTGPAFVLAPSLPVETNCDSGRGLFIISKLGSNLHVERTARGNRVSIDLPVSLKALPVWLLDGARFEGTVIQ